jgi:hypothetical protein
MVIASPAGVHLDSGFRRSNQIKSFQERLGETLMKPIYVIPAQAGI